MRLRLSLALALVCACTRGTPDPERDRETARPDTVEPDAITFEAPRLDARGPLEFGSAKLQRPSVFPSDPSATDEPLMTDEPDRIGWAAGADEFVHCAPFSGSGCRHCTFLRPGEEPELVRVGDVEDCDVGAVDTKTFAKRLAAGGYAIRDGDWRFGRDIVFTFHSKPGMADDFGTRRDVLEIGARLREGSCGTTWLERVRVCEGEAGHVECAPDIHVDGFAPSPDGESVAVALHSFAGEFTDTYPLFSFSAEDVALAVYTDEGLAALEAMDYARAVDWFTRASAAKPGAWKGPYNVACAHARAGDEGHAEAALAEALRRGGDAVREKAREDPDFARVAQTAWFRALIQ